jgi:hypothetical protein
MGTQDSEARRESMMKMLSNVVEARSHGDQSPDHSQPHAAPKEPVVRGDGTVLPERAEEDQPINRMKRMLDTGVQGPKEEL